MPSCYPIIWGQHDIAPWSAPKSKYTHHLSNSNDSNGSFDSKWYIWVKKIWGWGYLAIGCILIDVNRQTTKESSDMKTCC